MRASRSDHNEDRGSLRVLALVFPLSWFAAVALFLSPVPGVHRADFGTTATFHCGLVVMALGLLLRWWSVATLGRLFTVTVAIRSGHSVIDRGPYHSIRHPSYTAILLFHLGAALCFGNALSLLVLTIPTTAALLRRIRVEEDVLLSNLGAAYRGYMTRTKRLIPGVY
jgi:protein-S-isoprenylcysteine O-methyltransferase Ste14